MGEGYENSVLSPRLFCRSKTVPQKVYRMKKGKEMGQNVATFHFGPQKKLGTQDRVGV